MKKKTTEQFIKEAKSVHGDKYDYSKVNYKGCFEKVCIICPIHGEFWQTPAMHLSGQGCSKCCGRKKKTKEEFIADAKKVHGDKYDYSKVDYVNNKTKVIITCPIHGDFLQRPDRHLFGCGCNKCGYDNTAEKCKIGLENFIIEAKKVHGNKYDYSKVEYVNNHTKICIICPKHGEFWQTPTHHIYAHQGCPICNESHLENDIKMFLLSKNEKFIQQYKTDWLGLQTLDFYLPKYNAAIECQGKQHFGLGGWTKEYDFESSQERDERKKHLCEENGVQLFYYSNLGIKYPYKVYEDKNKMLKDIKHE